MRASLCARCLHKLAEVMKEKNLADDYIVDYWDPLFSLYSLA